MYTRLKQRGISLIELIIFIVVVSVALAGILRVMNVTGKSSADPLIYKQSLAIAQALLEEVELMPFTYCDPDDPAAATATSTLSCTQVDNMGPELAFGTQTSNETRYGPSYFDNVNDYNGFAMNSGNGGIKDITNTAIPVASSYSASAVVAPKVFSGINAADANGAPQALLITVTVTGSNGVTVVLEGMRTRYAPRALP